MLHQEFLIGEKAVKVEWTDKSVLLCYPLGRCTANHLMEHFAEISVVFITDAGGNIAQSHHRMLTDELHGGI